MILPQLKNTDKLNLSEEVHSADEIKNQKTIGQDIDLKNPRRYMWGQLLTKNGFFLQRDQNLKKHVLYE